MFVFDRREVVLQAGEHVALKILHAVAVFLLRRHQRRENVAVVVEKFGVLEQIVANIARHDGRFISDGEIGFASQRALLSLCACGFERLDVVRRGDRLSRFLPIDHELGQALVG